MLIGALYDLSMRHRGFALARRYIRGGRRIRWPAFCAACVSWRSNTKVRKTPSLACALSLYLFSRAGCGCVRAWEGERKGGGSSGRGGRERRSRARGGIFLSRLSRRRFISGSRKTNGEIVSKILTAHLGEHVALSPTRPPPFPPSSRAAPGC